jgi:serine/threonine protein kinase
MKQAINMFRILVALDRSASASPRVPLYVEQKRPNDVSVWVQPHCVIKECHPASDPVYALLESKAGASGTVRVEKKRRGADGRAKLMITPVCVSEPPKTEVELRSAVGSVLTALVSLHGISYAHRDIRWENVLKSDVNSWLLADFEEAAKTGDPLDPRTRNDAARFLPQKVLRRPHSYTTKSNVWAVGRLMEKWASDTHTILSRAVKSFMHGLLKEKQVDRPTAEAALTQLRRLS